MASLSLVFDLLARDRASAEFRKVGDAAQTAGKHASGFGTGVSGAMKLAAGAIAAAGIGRAFVGFVKDAQESARISRLTEAVVKSTSGAAKITAGQVNALATAISNKTAVDDEQVQSASNLLLTFTKVRNETGKGNDIFNRAAQAAIDMSVAMGTDANGAALQLGKALNDPIKGVSALSRAGVSFTAQQKEQIKAMVKAGDTLGAQKIILGEMQTQFGGAAAAAADPLERLKVIAGNLGEQIGGALLPSVGRFANLLADRLIPGIQKFGARVGPVFATVRDAVLGFIGAFTGNGSDALERFSGPTMNRIITAGAMAREAFDTLMAAGRRVFGFIRDTAIPVLIDFGGWIVRNRGWLADVAVAVLAAVTAFKAFMFIKSVIAAVAAFNAVLLANPIGLVIAALAALVAGLVIAYRHSETFRNIVDAAFRVVAATGKWLWENVLRPYFTAMWTLWSNVAKGIAWAWTNLLQPAWKGVVAYVTFMWNNILKPYFTAIGAAWGLLGGAIKAVFNNVIKPVFDGFSKVVGVVRDSFRTAVDAIKRVWDTLSGALMKPVKVVVDVVWNNGLRKLWNTINNVWGGSDLPEFRMASGGMLPISRRGQFASGGVLPGYTPGRDVHSFVSPTGGRLDLSGGEAIMRPEFTRTLGAANIDRLNKIAREQGEAGLRRALGDGPGLSTALPSWLSTGGSIFSPALSGAINDALKQHISGANGADMGGGLFGAGLAGMAKKILSNLWDKAKALFDGEDSGGGAGMGYQAQMGILRRVFPGLQLISGFRPGAITATGNRSYHSMGRAVDVPPQMAIFDWISRNYGSRTKELIFSPAGGRQIHNGARHMYSGITRAMHWDHVHWAMKNGGIFGRIPSYQTGTDFVPQTGPAILHKGERVVPAEQNVAGVGGTHITVEAHTSDERRIARAIEEGQRIREFLHA